MGRRTKAELEAERKPKVIKEIASYIIKNGKKLNDNFIYWNTYPLCVKDICVLAAVYKNNQVVFCDYDEDTNKITRDGHTAEELEYEYLIDIFSDMKDKDEKQNKKSKK